MMSDPNTFNCPTCGATLTPPGDGAARMICPFCNNNVTIPTELRANTQSGQLHDRSSRKKAILHELMRLVGSGNKIGAIKFYREQFDVGLAQAKEAIDALDDGRGIELPDPVGPDTYPRPIEQLTNSAVQPRTGNFSRRVIFALLSVGILLAISAIVVGVAANAVIGGSLSALPTLPAIQLNPPSLLSDPAIMLAAGDGAPDIALQGRHFNTDPETNVLVRMSTKDGKIVWESEPFAGKSPLLRDLVSDGAHIYTVIDDQLSAYQASNGKQIWNITLSDELGYCGKDRGISCLKVYKDILLVLCKDDTLQAFAAPTGKQLWTREDQAALSSGAGILLIKDQVMAFEQTQKGNDALLLLNPATGQETERLTTDGLYSYTPVYYDSTNQNIYLVFGSSVEKWSFQGSQPERVWEMAPTDYYASNYSKGLLTSDSLYVNLDNVTSAIDTQNGKVRFTLSLKDYIFTPLAAQGKRVLVLAQRTRGTNRYELWGVDTTSGNKVWSISFDKSQPIGDFSGTVDDPKISPWLWRVRGNNLSIAQFKTEPDQIDMQIYQIEDGKQISAGSGVINNSNGNYFLGDVLGWQADTFWMVLNSHLFAIDIGKGQVRLVGP
jgi:outer membrane protein assembly factor BamB